MQTLFETQTPGTAVISGCGKYPDALLIEQSPAMHAMLRLLQKGAARFEPAIGEFCFDQLRYVASDGEWDRTCVLISWKKIREALA